ncbi:MAG: prepilin-type N-terminal cleavage/methylation domain-containing protein [Pseudomonadota bacterium]|nr:prepilin-type N-terminal cleavage/methylation domain-containing protein [Pseudomonadota bacterium]
MMRRRASGFTLVELLVAISILGMVAVLGWRGLDGIVRARANLTEQMEVTRGMQLAFAQMQSDSEQMANSALVGNRQTLDSSDGRLTLVRTVLLENTASRVQVISYRLIDGVLLRRESAATRDLAQLDILWKAAISDTDTTPPVALQSGIATMQMLIWQNGVWRQSVAGNVVAQGLQVAMQVQNAEAPMSKSFLLGGL